MYTKVLVLLVLTARSLGSIHTCDEDDSIDITKGTHLSNGDIYFNGVRYDKSEYYLDSETGEEKGCLCKKNTCVYKCCPFGYGYDSTLKRCVNVSEPFEPPVLNKYKQSMDVNASELFHFVIGKVNCTLPDYRIRIGQAISNYGLGSSGELYIEFPKRIPPWLSVGPDKYCIDTFLYEKGGVKTMRLDALICFRDSVKDHKYYPISSTCMLISCVFILATVAVYAWLPELQNLHGRVLMAYLICLFIGFIFMSSMQILLLKDNITSDICVSFTFIIYFSLLSAFFWLNVMCFDIWWTFSGKRGISEHMSTRARFGAYAVYAFGVPTLLTCLMAALEFSGLPPHALMPNLRIQGCFIYGHSKILYFYGPIAVLCISNIVYFILTAVKIAQIKSQTSVLKSKESARHDQHRSENDKQRFFLYVKLFVVMGVNWLLEVASGTYPDAFDWQYTDAYNVLIGVFIFIIFVCKRKIFRLIKKRYRQMRGESISRTQTVSSRTASTRDDFRMSSVKTATA